MLTRQVLNYLSHTSSPFALVIFIFLVVLEFELTLAREALSHVTPPAPEMRSCELFA
jgi:hypothetical protein